MLGYAIAPSTMYDVRSEDDELEGFMIAQGNPFVMDPGVRHAHTHMHMQCQRGEAAESHARVCSSSTCRRAARTWNVCSNHRAPPLRPQNHTTQMNFGGVAYMKADGCKNLFPLFPNPYAATGVVVNTIDCHAPSGMCFFSLWKFDGAPSPIAMWV
jgi:hypothetical protein